VEIEVGVFAVEVVEEDHEILEIAD
jgi:hypothetical protein